MFGQDTMNLIVDARKEAKLGERNRIKLLILNNGFLTRTEKHGHGYLIPDDLWPELFPKD